MKKRLKIALLALVGVFTLTLLTLRLTGLEPAYDDPSSETFARNNRISRPGLWLRGEVVREPVKDWSFVVQRLRPGTGRCSGLSRAVGRYPTIQVETRTWYGIPHSVTVGGDFVRDGKLYIHAHSDPHRMQIPFPDDKAWTRNVARDPRVRLKIAGKIYEAILVPVTDRAEANALLGCDPITMAKGPDGREYPKEVMHIWRVFQMNISDYSDGYQGPPQQVMSNR